MLPSVRASGPQSAIATILGLLGVSAATFFSYRFGLNLASTILLHLLVVVMVAVKAGFWNATLVSVFANLSVAYFIVPPAFSFFIADTKNWVALAVFEFTALVVSRLSTNAQLQAANAANRQREIERLYEFSRELLLLDRCSTPSPQIVVLIERLFGATAVGLYSFSTGQIDLAGSCDASFKQLMLDADGPNRTLDQGLPTTWLKTLHIGGKPNNCLAVRGTLITDMTFNALASLTSVALERSWCFEKENRAEAERQTERLRSAVLDALAHEYKTPLTTIRTASSTILAISGVTGAEIELVSLIDSETEKLDRLTTRLLQTSRLDSSQVRLHLESVHACDIVRDVLASLQEQLKAHKVRTYGLEMPLELNVDRELMVMALSQLVDNACKYSDSGSTIRIDVAELAAAKCISVHNIGPPIPSDQLEHIFDRFYRSPQHQSRAIGTGLGLSVTKKIMEAHSGHVSVRSEMGGNTFTLNLPKMLTGLKQAPSVVSTEDFESVQL